MKDKLKKLSEILNGYGKIAVALSGGVDSVFLLTFAHELCNDDRVTALTATGPHFAADETEYAKKLCQDLGINHQTVATDHVLHIIENNPPDRCYYCKKEIFSSLKRIASDQGFILADGTNLDDMDDYRPGYTALTELGIASPLKDAYLTKAEIRTALKDLAGKTTTLYDALTISDSKSRPLPIWEKPAFACLASRIPYGEKITEKKLIEIYKAETLLRSLGFDQVRVRHHGDVARIEVLPNDRTKFYNERFMNDVNNAIKKCGFRFAALDLGGYKMGNMNDANNDHMIPKGGKHD